MLGLGFNVVATLLFIAEFYHIIGHTVILFRVRMLPRKDLVKIRPYFLIDALTVFITGTCVDDIFKAIQAQHNLALNLSWRYALSQ
jgi:hypothetical protein